MHCLSESDLSSVVVNDDSFGRGRHPLSNVVQASEMCTNKDKPINQGVKDRQKERVRRTY